MNDRLNEYIYRNTEIVGKVTQRELILLKLNRSMQQQSIDQYVYRGCPQYFGYDHLLLIECTSVENQNLRGPCVRHMQQPQKDGLTYLMLSLLRKRFCNNNHYSHRYIYGIRLNSISNNNVN